MLKGLLIKVFSQKADKFYNRQRRTFPVKIVTAKELGQYLKLSESTIYKLAGNGEIPGFRLGDSWRFDMDEILQTIRGAKEKQDSQH
jgi:excisionase family DNA binding protein